MIRKSTKQRADILNQLHAFKLYKDKGMGEVMKYYPMHKQVVLSNQYKTFEAFEKEMHKKLHHLKTVA